MPSVLIVQELLTHYRVPFYEQLRERLSADGIHLELVHGRSSGPRSSRSDEATLGWAREVATRRVPTPFSVERGVWQSVTRLSRRHDLVVVEHANRQLANYPLLMAGRASAGPRVAFWGHGGNLQAPRRNSAAESFKRVTARFPHWWFAYTEGAAERVAALGFPQDRITTVQNAIDTSEYRGIEKKREASRVVYLGSLHRDKRITFLLESMKFLAARVPDLRFDIVGDGEERALVEHSVQRYPWMHYHGALQGERKARVVSGSSLVMMPGMVGLAILDAFAARTPVVTINLATHSPEFEYVRTGENALVLDRATRPLHFAEQVAALLADAARLERLRAGCAVASETVTIGVMVENFANGVTSALETPGTLPLS